MLQTSTENVGRSDAVLFGDSLLDETDDDHEDGAAHPAASYLADQAADIETTCLGAGCRCRATEDAKRAEELTAEATPDDPCDAVPDGAEALLSQRATGDVAADSATDQADDQTDDPSMSSPPE
jgi:hypothetical protein